MRRMPDQVRDMSLGGALAWQSAGRSVRGLRSRVRAFRAGARTVPRPPRPSGEAIPPVSSAASAQREEVVAPRCVSAARLERALPGSALAPLPVAAAALAFNRTDGAVKCSPAKVEATETVLRSYARAILSAQR